MMNSAHSSREQLLQKIVEYGNACTDIRGLAQVGSGARADHPADKWSDIDLILVTPRLDLFLHSSAWLNDLSDPWVDTVERNDAGNIVERRVLYRNGIDVDFIVLSCDGMQALQKEPLSDIIRRGARVLLDKDGLFPLFHTEDRSAIPNSPPTAVEFSELVNNFWFHAVWTAKKIKRGELWTAKSCCDTYMKRLLLTMIEWHTCSLKGWDTKTWYNGRFIEQWASPVIVERLHEVFAYYDETDLWRALIKTIQLFNEVATDAARQLMVPYSEDVAQSVREWIYNAAGF